MNREIHVRICESLRGQFPRATRPHQTLADIAKQEGVDAGYVSRMVNLTVLAPDIVVLILDDALPDGAILFDLAVDTPALWVEQRGRVDISTIIKGAAVATTAVCKSFLNSESTK